MLFYTEIKQNVLSFPHSLDALIYAQQLYSISVRAIPLKYFNYSFIDAGSEENHDGPLGSS